MSWNGKLEKMTCEFHKTLGELLRVLYKITTLKPLASMPRE